MSKLDFVLPVYKPRLDLLEKCVKSLIGQSLTEWTATFVLDGPNEEAAKLIGKLFKKSANHFKVVEIEHGGACKARNEGFKHTTAPYVVFFDSDCLIEPHAASAWVDQFEKDPTVGMVYSGYKFLDERGAINSEPFDPYTLGIANYISTCFPVRRELAGTWDESLESAQDWDWWLGVVSRGGTGKFLQGYAFSTAYPTPESISGKGCTPEVWLERQDKVRAKHGLPRREVCVTSVANKHDGIALAKLIGADYHDRPADKPNHYKTIIQIGFGLNPGVAETYASAWGQQHKKVLFWTAENIEEAYHGIAVSALDEYASRLNQACVQFVADKAAQKIMTRCGFQTEVMPVPTTKDDEIPPMPEQPRFLVDASAQYGHALAVVKKALPDVKIDIASGAQEISAYTGLIHFYVDRMQTQSIVRMLLNGRRVISNVQQPYAGFTEDRVQDEKFIVSLVEKIRAEVKKGANVAASDYYKKALSADRLMAALR